MSCVSGAALPQRSTRDRRCSRSTKQGLALTCPLTGSFLIINSPEQALPCHGSTGGVGFSLDPEQRYLYISDLRNNQALAAVPSTSPRLRVKPAVTHDVDARLSKVLAPARAARGIVDRPHRSSVSGRETAASPRAQALKGDRSTVTDASTPHMTFFSNGMCTETLPILCSLEQ